MGAEGRGDPVADRVLVEDVVRLLLTQAPPGWQLLHGEFEPRSRPMVAQASVTTADGRQQPLNVAPGAVSLLADYQRLAEAAGAPWQRIVVDCHADGRLSAHTQPATAASAARDHRRLRQILMMITVGCLTGAAVLFAVAWKWSAPPRADVIPVHAASPRQGQAFDVVSKWFDAMNRGDAAGMRALACSEPAPSAPHLIDAVEQTGRTHGLMFPDAVLYFSDSGRKISMTVALRARPLDEFMAKRVEEAQRMGGFFLERFVLADEGGQLRVCDDNTG